MVHNFRMLLWTTANLLVKPEHFRPWGRWRNTEPKKLKYVSLGTFFFLNTRTCRSNILRQICALILSGTPEKWSPRRFRKTDRSHWVCFQRQRPNLCSVSKKDLSPAAMLNGIPWEGTVQIGSLPSRWILHYLSSIRGRQKLRAYIFLVERAKWLLAHSNRLSFLFQQL